MDNIATVIESLGLTIKADFVPFSQSRSKGNKNPSLNWIVTLERNGVPVIVTDYMAGSGHCPSYGKAAPSAWDRPNHYWIEAVCDFECEIGYKAKMFTHYGGFTPDRTAPIKPKTDDVIYSLVTDSDVINYSGFEDWAENFGYDTDSRSTESIYKACLDTALKLRSGIGDSGLEMLREAYQDY